MLQQLTDSIRKLLGVAPAAHPVATSAKPAPAEAVPAAIRNFARAASTPGPDQDWLMGSLKAEGITPYDFGKWCSAFATGVYYVYQRFGTCPAGIMVVDMEPGKSAFYNADSRTIFISRQMIGNLINNYANIQGKTDPYALFAEQQALTSGVEEAYHHYQFSTNPAHYTALLSSYIPHLTGKVATDGSHDLHPMEAEAKIIVQDAMKTYRLDRMPIAPVHDPKWQEYIKHQHLEKASAGTPVIAH